ncbi:hypothetical protein [Microbacterium azadirachtae]|uniref:Glycosyl hydrolases family 43 n=2 Tax=Microbacterium azadirachtae TaxID=582680 RepID=A0A1I6G5G9_9MICO|nr:hypothetical protein [Microbacterium azadirachtae]SDL34802.1 hypothetical protein SAMN04488593_0784 [Microbacterium azadirachtae]SEF65381.1 hypothetical protein SAMN04488594_0774 [Microbacterium azadirachtae]SEF66217.1 hypothetical protein SAMN04488592_0783 [Microbacterium azadirachtae]SFR37444.1 hypothetical protein SAMN04488591_0780 [Microbacterium azadirachtae]
MSMTSETCRAPAPTARMQARDGGVVLRHGDGKHGDRFGARDVWVFTDGDQYLMHYDAAGDHGWLAALATSPDGVHWTKHGPVLDLGHLGAQDSGSASYGTTYFDGRNWHMFYLGTPNVLDDGFRTPAFPYMTMKAEGASAEGPWRKRPDITPFLAADGTWYDDTASPGAVVQTEEGYVMLFSAATTAVDGRVWRTLGTARTDDLSDAWTVDPHPLLPLTEQIENSSLYFEESTGTWFLFTNHIAELVPEMSAPHGYSREFTDAIWVYWAPDLSSFTPENKAIVVDTTVAEWSPLVVGLPSVLRIGERLAVYYDGSSKVSISHGRRDVGVAWLDLPLRVPEGATQD